MVINFYQLSRADAAEFFELYIRQEGPQVEWLRARSGLSLSPTREGLVELWTWWLANRDTLVLQPSDRLPVWCVPDGGDETEVSGMELQVLDCAAFVFARAIRSAFPNAYWHLVTSPKREYAEENQPVLTCDGRMHCNTRWIVVGHGGELRLGLEDPSRFNGPIRALAPDGLAQVFDAWLRYGL